MIADVRGRERGHSRSLYMVQTHAVLFAAVFISIDRDTAPILVYVLGLDTDQSTSA